MSLSRLAEKCQKCPKVDTCDHKKMEALGLLPGEPTMEQIMNNPGIYMTPYPIGSGQPTLLVAASQIKSMKLEVNAEPRNEFLLKTFNYIGRLEGHHGKE